MGQAVATIISVLLIVAYIVAMLSIFSALLFLVGLWRFIRYEKRLAQNWNKLRSYSRGRPGSLSEPRHCRGNPPSGTGQSDAGRVYRMSQ